MGGLEHPEALLRGQPGLRYHYDHHKDHSGYREEWTNDPRSLEGGAFDGAPVGLKLGLGKLGYWRSPP